MAIAVEQDLVQVARNLGPLLRENAERSDREGRLPAESMRALRDAGFFRMWVPRALGGLEVDPVTYARVQEELSRHDSAAGWILQASGSSDWWCSRLPTEAIEEIYAGGPDQIISVSFANPVEASPVPGGLRISGQRPFASNVSDASWIWLTALTIENGGPVTMDGAPVVRALFLPAHDATVVHTWDTLGMRGSDSNDVVVNDVVVPDHRAFRVGIDHTPGPFHQGPLYRLPAMVTVGSYIPPVALGVARSAIDELVDLAPTKTPFASTTNLAGRTTVQAKIGRAEGALRSARAYLYDRLAWGWDQTVAGVEHTLEQKAEMLLAAVQAHAASVEAVDLMYSAAGSTAIHKRHPMERLFRDVHVLQQQGFLSESRFETVGQVSLGLPPELGFVAL